MNPTLHEETVHVLLDKSSRDAHIAIDAGCLAAIRSNRQDLLPTDLLHHLRSHIVSDFIEYNPDLNNLGVFDPEQHTRAFYQGKN